MFKKMGERRREGEVTGCPVLTTKEVERGKRRASIERKTLPYRERGRRREGNEKNRAE